MRASEDGAALGYLTREFPREQAIECRFGEPIAEGDRAAVEWWASWTEDGRELTLAGATILRFDDEGRVVEHVDYWNEADGRVSPFDGWGR
jgi:predicted SnoaL-like aldol condensation-catalyzing enzyme